MNKLLATSILLLIFIGSASTQISAKNYKEPRVRFGVGYRYSLGLAYQAKIEVEDYYKVAEWGLPFSRRGGGLMLEGTVRIDSNWSTGLGLGFGSYFGNTGALKPYLKGEYLYGQRPSRWFNYANLGATIRPGEDGAGLFTELGGGYRMAITHRTRLDFTIGLEYLNLVSGGYALVNNEWIGSSTSGRINRFGLTFGIAMHF